MQITPALLLQGITKSYKNQNYLNSRHRFNLSACPVTVTAQILPFQTTFNSAFTGRLLQAQNQCWQLMQTIPVKT